MPRPQFDKPTAALRRKVLGSIGKLARKYGDNHAKVIAKQREFPSIFPDIDPQPCTPNASVHSDSDTNDISDSEACEPAPKRKKTTVSLDRQLGQIKQTLSGNYRKWPYPV